mgnify:CR=1 FL=1
MDERKCAFCEAYKYRLELNNSTAGLIHKLTVALVSRAKRPDEKIFRGRIIDYNARGAGFKLNYCPECGRSLKKLRRNT